MIHAADVLRRYMKFVLASLGCISICPSAAAQTYTTMSWEEYARHSDMYRWPYILNIYTSHGGLFYFGVSHSHDPQNEQFSEIEALWKQFHPEIALNEGNTPNVDNKTRNEAIQDGGDPGLVSYLAAHDNVKVESMDPPLAEEVAETP